MDGWISALVSVYLCSVGGARLKLYIWETLCKYIDLYRGLTGRLRQMIYRIRVRRFKQKSGNIITKL